MADDSRPPSDRGRGSSDSEDYSEEELNRYFNDPEFRQRGASQEPSAQEPSAQESSAQESSAQHSAASSGTAASSTSKPRQAPGPKRRRPRHGVRGFFHKRLGPQKAQAAFVLSILAGLLLLGALVLAGYVTSLAAGEELPSTKQIENPTFELATVAYTADGKVLARYALQNRSWVTADEISPNVKNALVATEDHRFYTHWGMDLFRTTSAVLQTLMGDRQGGSTITQQLARNLYNKQIGRDISVERKVKEMITAVQIERRYTKQEILEMYLNTVEFGHNAFGIEAAAQTYYDTTAAALNPLQAATFVGMLKAPSYYDPTDHPRRSRTRRNTVLKQRVKFGNLSEAYYQKHKDQLPRLDFQSAELASSLAPYFAEHVRNWMKHWADKNGYNFYTDGLRVYTTLDASMQKLADAAVQKQTQGLQKVVDYEWSRRSGYFLGKHLEDYADADSSQSFDYFWKTHPGVVNDHMEATRRYQSLRDQGASEEDALAQLKKNEAFVDSLRSEVTRLSAGLVSIDPRTGGVKAWVGGRDFEEGKYDHVSLAERQPGSTFKPFVYTTAIDNGYSPYYTLKDSTFTYTIEGATEKNKKWAPSNFGGSTGQMKTLRQGLAHSLNTITAGVMMKLVNPHQVAFYARKMGIRKSKLKEVPSLALGAGEVTLLEMASAYSTLANGGLYNEPQVITRIEDRNGNLLYQAKSTPEEALSEQTAYTVVDMMRDVVDYGTGQRIRWQWGLDDYDLAGKTGTTQKSADGWFMLMHPQLVTGAWVGFNDRRVAFRSSFWGQGAHNALFLVGDYFRRLTRSSAVQINQRESFPLPETQGEGRTRTVSDESGDGQQQQNGNDDDGRVGW